MESVVIAVENPETGSNRIKVFDRAQDAQSYIELLLAGGTESRLIRVFAAEELMFSVRARPVVTLSAGANDHEAPPVPAEQPASEAAVPSPDGIRERLPYHRDGERFSSLFKTD